MVYNYRARYYAPSFQRFISEDPIGAAGGVNLYAYVNNHPTIANDPFGLLEKDSGPWISEVAFCRALGLAGTYCSGFADHITFGVTDDVRDMTGANSAVDKSSSTYMAGTCTGVAWEVAFGAAGGARAAAGRGLARGMSRANPAFPRGIEWVERSHWIPKRWLPNSMKWAQWNTKPMWGSEHAACDPLRYRFMKSWWKDLNPPSSALVRQWTRMPGWAQGAAVGGAYSLTH